MENKTTPTFPRQVAFVWQTLYGTIFLKITVILTLICSGFAFMAHFYQSDRILFALSTGFEVLLFGIIVSYFAERSRQLKELKRLDRITHVAWESYYFEIARRQGWKFRLPSTNSPGRLVRPTRAHHLTEPVEG